MTNKLTIKQWAVDDRPREKLFKLGEEKLSDAEILALILRTGTKGETALDLARQIINIFGSLRQISSCKTQEWKLIKGLGDAKIAQIRASFELGRRVLEDKVQQELPKIQSARDVANLLSPRMRDLKIEVFRVVYLNGQNGVIAIEDIAQGTVNHVTPIIREILHKALTHYASAIICAHNHPSGNLLPSKEDQVFTNAIKSACVLMGIKFVDHIIISPHGYRSVN